MNDALARYLAGTITETPSSSRSRKRKPNAVVRKLLGYRRFFDGLPALAPRLSPGAVAVWCWLWTNERKAHSRCTVRKLGKRFGIGKSTAERWLAELREAGFIQIVRRGQTGTTPSVVRVRPSPPKSSG